MPRFRPAIYLLFLQCLIFLASCRGGQAPAVLTPTVRASAIPTLTQAPTAFAPTQVPLQSSPNPAGFDLRFANVTQVEFEHISDLDYRFSVTLFHDDDGEAPAFADAWLVEDLQGNVLGRRELLHSHGTQPFTRSHTISIPEAVNTVLVKGHDMIHGFGGQAMQVNLATGETTAVQSATDSP